MSRAMSSDTKIPSDSRPQAAGTGAKGGNPGGARPSEKDARLAQALRDNLKKRKVQKRERQDGQRGHRDDGPGDVGQDGGQDGGA